MFSLSGEANADDVRANSQKSTAIIHSCSVLVATMIASQKRMNVGISFSNKSDKRHGPACKVKTCIPNHGGGKGPMKVERKVRILQVSSMGWLAGEQVAGLATIILNTGRSPDLELANIHPSTQKSFFAIQKKPLIKRGQSPPRYCTCTISYGMSTVE